MNRHPLRITLLAAVACALGSCTVPDIDLTGKACDPPAHVCLAGWSCVNGICVQGTPDAGEQDAGADAGPGVDAGPPDSGPGPDAGVDAGQDAGSDAGASDAGTDAGLDAGLDCSTCGSSACLGKACNGPGASICRTGGGSTICCPDSDSDGFDSAACGGLDCNDSDPTINPNATEICGDTVDQDCDGDPNQGWIRPLAASTGLVAATSRRTEGYAVFYSTTSGYVVQTLGANGTAVAPIFSSSNPPLDAQIGRLGDKFLTLALLPPNPTFSNECGIFAEAGPSSTTDLDGGLPNQAGTGHYVAVASSASTISSALPDPNGVTEYFGRSATVTCPSSAPGATFGAETVSLASTATSDWALYVNAGGASPGDLVMAKIGSPFKTLATSTQLPISPVLIEPLSGPDTPWASWIDNSTGVLHLNDGGTTIAVGQAGQIYKWVSGAAADAGIRLLALSGTDLTLLLGAGSGRLVTTDAGNFEPALTSNAAGDNFLAVWFDDSSGQVMVRTTCP